MQRCASAWPFNSSFHRSNIVGTWPQKQYELFKVSDLMKFEFSELWIVLKYRKSARTSRIMAYSATIERVRINKVPLASFHNSSNWERVLFLTQIRAADHAPALISASPPFFFDWFPKITGLSRRRYRSVSLYLLSLGHIKLELCGSQNFPNPRIPKLRELIICGPGSRTRVIYKRGARTC